MNVKVIISLCVMACLVFCSCSQDEVIYSCDKEVDAWVKENLSDIQKMNRSNWRNLDSPLQQGAYVAFTPEQKHLFWLEKMQEVLSLDWNDAEKEHIDALYKTIINNPQWFASDFSNNEQQFEKFELLVYQWREYAEESLGWNKNQIGAIVAIGNKMLNKNGSLAFKSTATRLRSGYEPCNCNQKYDFCNMDTECNDSSCDDVPYCGWFLLSTCNGRCTF